MSSTTTGSPGLSPRDLTPAVETVLAFVNTRADGTGRPELFGDGDSFTAWLAEHDGFGGFGGSDSSGDSDGSGGGTVATDADAAAARELRDALVTVLLAHSGDEESLGEPLRRAERHLRRAGSLYPLATVVTAGGVELASPQTGVERVFGTVLAAVTTFARSGDWGRVKACRNPPCHFGFLDRTRNGGGLYCSPGCGSQVSMRNYRRRQRQAT
ncbi:CGNR zinc finger domain-containing protein [Kitasatospora sp. NPDC004799]|uniref:CGNR zinc finger domain-containing protein n=1 Tax=Kitasatospora sp. NPDC004799 TaxID=3154460 RepID=UPI0033A9361F